MKQQTLIVKSATEAPERLQQAAKIIQGYDGSIELVIKPHKGKRSLLQNSMSHALYPQVADFMSCTTAEARGYCKYRIGFEVLSESKPEYVDRVRKVLSPLNYETRLLACYDLPCTSEMTVKQMTDYIDQVVMHFAQQGYVITMPADKGLDHYPEAAQ